MKAKKYIEQVLNEGKDSDMQTISIRCRDRDNKLKKLLEEIKARGNTGHSFDIVVEPDTKDAKTIGWDGDGSDYIESIMWTKE